MNQKKINDLDKRILADLENKIEKELNKSIGIIEIKNIFEFRQYHHQIFQMNMIEEDMIERRKIGDKKENEKSE